jgi:uncharacterized protein (DUF3084 family)
MADLVKQYQALEARLEKAKLEKAKLEGQKESILNTLKEDFDINSIKEAKEQLFLYKEEIDEQENEIKELIEQATKLLGS